MIIKEMTEIRCEGVRKDKHGVTRKCNRILAYICGRAIIKCPKCGKVTEANADK